jgi:hypothetical protein
MVKKRRTTKRLTRVAKRRPPAKRKWKAKPVKQDNTAPVVTNFDPTPYLIAARQRDFPAAVQSTIGEASTPLPLRAEQTMAGTSDAAINPFVLTAAVPVRPTVYPDSPDETVIVQNYITINAESVEYNNFDITMDALVQQLQVGRSNEISGDVCAQLLSEITAGRDLLKGAKPNRDLIEHLLIRPLKWLAEKAAGAILGTIAGEALDLLLKMIM